MPLGSSQTAYQTTTKHNGHQMLASKAIEISSRRQIAGKAVLSSCIPCCFFFYLELTLLGDRLHQPQISIVAIQGRENSDM